MPKKSIPVRKRSSQPVVSRRIVIHTDGSASVKNRTGGWAFIARHGERMADRCGFAHGTTISEMEILAISKSLQFLTPESYPISIYSDSQYAVNALTRWGPMWEQCGWTTSTGKPVSHKELIQSTLRLIEEHRQFRIVEIHWIRGHSGTQDNELADSLAGQARRDGCGTWRKEDQKFRKMAHQLKAK